MPSARIRLCIVTPAHWAAFMGGSQYQIKCLLDELVPQQRCDIYYAARRVAPDFRAEGYRIVPIGRNGSVPKLGYTMDRRRLDAVLREIRPDVIYQRVACGYTGIAASYAKRHGARLIWHVASDGDVALSSPLGGRGFIRRYLEQRSIAYGIRHADHIVAQTEHQAACLHANYGRRVDAVIPNFHPAPREPLDKSGPVSVVWIANFKPLKQPEAFIRLAAGLKDLKGVRFVMIGAQATGPENRRWNRAVMQAIAATSNVEYLGQRSQEEINRILAGSHLLVNTSRYEGFSNTFVQAWMRGVPVVSLNVNPDGVLDRERVGVFAAGSESSLAEQVRDLACDSGKLGEHAARARAYALRRHSMANALMLASLIETGGVAPAEGIEPHPPQPPAG